jgi:hypothetical protein
VRHGDPAGAVHEPLVVLVPTLPAPAEGELALIRSVCLSARMNTPGS